jgi:hypothetical protein
MCVAAPGTAAACTRGGHARPRHTARSLDANLVCAPRLKNFCCASRVGVEKYAASRASSNATARTAAAARGQRLLCRTDSRPGRRSRLRHPPRPQLRRANPANHSPVRHVGAIIPQGAQCEAPCRCGRRPHGGKVRATTASRCGAVTVCSTHTCADAGVSPRGSAQEVARRVGRPPRPPPRRIQAPSSGLGQRGRPQRPPARHRRAR